MTSYDKVDYTPNSHKYKEEVQNREEEKTKDKRTEKIVNGNVTIKKKSGLSKTVSDGASIVGNHIWKDILLPLIKKTICEIFEDVPKMLIYGDSKKGRSIVDNVSYSTRYSDRGSIRVSSVYETHDFGNVVLDDRQEAEQVLQALDEIMDVYGLVRVADLYELVGKTADYPANDYGWKSLASARIVSVPEGYMIKMPKAFPIL